MFTNQEIEKIAQLTTPKPVNYRIPAIKKDWGKLIQATNDLPWDPQAYWWTVKLIGRNRDWEREWITTSGTFQFARIEIISP